MHCVKRFHGLFGLDLPAKIFFFSCLFFLLSATRVSATRNDVLTIYEEDTNAAKTFENADFFEGDSEEEETVRHRETRSASTLQVTFGATYNEESDPVSLLTSVAIQSDFNIQGAGATLSYYRDAENEVLQVDSIVPITIETTTPEGNTVNATYNISVQASYAFPTLTITGPIGVREYEAVIATLTYVNRADEPTSDIRTASVFVTDGSVTVKSDIFFIVMNNLNDAPYFNNGTLPSFSIKEDADEFTQIPPNIYHFITGLNEDDDANSEDGVAILGVDNSHGTWEFLHNPGFWVAIQDGVRNEDGTINRTATTNSLVARNDHSNFVRYIPNENFVGTTTITLAAWDVTGTSANLADGSYTNAVWTTNSDPFSPNTITITMTVTPLNDAPNVNATGNIDLGTMLEGTAVSPVVQLTDLLRNCHDVDAEWDNTVINLGIGISRVDQSGGDWQYNLHQGASDQWLSISNNTLLLGENGNVTYQSLRFLPNPEYSGAAFLYFHCWDFTNNLLNGDTTAAVTYTGADGSFSQTEAIAYFTVTNVNDAPNFVGITSSVQLATYPDAVKLNEEGTAIQNLLATYFTDVDTIDSMGIAVVSIAGELDGVFQYTCDVNNDGSATAEATWMEFAGLVYQNIVIHAKPSYSMATVLMGTCKLRFIPNQNFSENSASLSTMTLIAWDGSDGTTSASSGINVTSDISSQAEASAFGSTAVQLIPVYTDPPARPAVILGSTAVISYQENSGSISIAPSAAITDLTAPQIQWITVTLSSILDSGLETIASSMGSTIAGTNVVVLSSTESGSTLQITLTGTDTEQNYATALQSITYTHNSDSPTNGQRTLAFVASDTDGVKSLPVTLSIQVMAVNDPPEISYVTVNPTLWDFVDFRSGGSAVKPFVGVSSFTVIDPDDHQPLTITVQITNVLDGLAESLNVPTTILVQTEVDSMTYIVKTLQVTSSYDAVNGILLINFPTSSLSSSAELTAILNEVTYNNTASTPNYNDRNIIVYVSDPAGAVSNQVQVTIRILDSGGNYITDPDNSSNNVPLSPSIVKLSAISNSTDSVDHSDAKLSAGDRIHITFDRDTNMPPFGYYDVHSLPIGDTSKILTRSQVDSIFVMGDPFISSTLTTAYNGIWTSSKDFEITIVSEGYPQPIVKVNTWTVSVSQDLSCDNVDSSSAYCLRDVTGRSNHSTSASPVLDGNFGLNVPDLHTIVINNEQVQTSVLSSFTDYIGDGTVLTVTIYPAFSADQIDSFCLMTFEQIFSSTQAFAEKNLQETISNCQNVITEGSWSPYGVANAALSRTTVITTDIPTISQLTISLSASSSTASPLTTASLSSGVAAAFNKPAVIDLVAASTGVDANLFTEYDSSHSSSSTEPSIFKEQEYGLTPAVSSWSIERGSSNHTAGDLNIYAGDVITLTFDKDTNTPDVATTSDLTKIFTFIPEVSALEGHWIDGNTLAIKIQNDFESPALDLTLTFTRNQFSDLTFIPDAYSVRPQCIGINVCGNGSSLTSGTPSVGVCNILTTSCRAYGSVTVYHVESTTIMDTTVSIESSVSQSESIPTVDWWWILLMGLIMIVCVGVITWLGRKVYLHRRDRKVEKIIGSDFEMYDTPSPTSTLDHGQEIGSWNKNDVFNSEENVRYAEIEEKYTGLTERPNSWLSSAQNGSTARSSGRFNNFHRSLSSIAQTTTARGQSITANDLFENEFDVFDYTPVHTPNSVSVASKLRTDSKRPQIDEIYKTITEENEIPRVRPTTTPSDTDIEVKEKNWLTLRPTHFPLTGILPALKEPLSRKKENLQSVVTPDGKDGLSSKSSQRHASVSTFSSDHKDVLVLRNKLIFDDSGIDNSASSYSSLGELSDGTLLHNGRFDVTLKTISSLPSVREERSDDLPVLYRSRSTRKLWNRTVSKVSADNSLGITVVENKPPVPSPFLPSPVLKPNTVTGRRTRVSPTLSDDFEANEKF